MYHIVGTEVGWR